MIVDIEIVYMIHLQQRFDSLYLFYSLVGALIIVMMKVNIACKFG